MIYSFDNLLLCIESTTVYYILLLFHLNHQNRNFRCNNERRSGLIYTSLLSISRINQEPHNGYASCCNLGIWYYSSNRFLKNVAVLGCTMTSSSKWPIVTACFSPSVKFTWIIIWRELSGSLPDPDNEIRGDRSSRPLDKGGGGPGLPKNFFRFGLKIRGGGGLPWIRHLGFSCFTR